MNKEFYTNIITNPNRTVLYIGVTNNIQKRVVEHYLNKVKKRKWKEEFIEKTNLEWKFLNEIVLGAWPTNKTVAS